MINDEKAFDEQRDALSEQLQRVSKFALLHFYDIDSILKWLRQRTESTTPERVADLVSATTFITIAQRDLDSLIKDSSESLRNLFAELYPNLKERQRITSLAESLVRHSIKISAAADALSHGLIAVRSYISKM